MTDQLILHQLEQLPGNLKLEVLDFIGYLFAKHQLPAANPGPSRRKRFGQYRGSLKSGLSRADVDAQLQQLRDEWERPIS